MWWEDSIIARAKQILGVECNSRSTIKKNFVSRIVRYHPDKQGPLYKEQTEVLIEAYHVLTGKIKPLNCNLLENNDLVASLLPNGVKPVTLGMKYEDWLKETFYDFVRPE